MREVILALRRLKKYARRRMMKLYSSDWPGMNFRIRKLGDDHHQSLTISHDNVWVKGAHHMEGRLVHQVEGSVIIKKFKINS